MRPFDQLIHNATRNSPVAEKPRDAFVQMQWRGWPKTRPSYVRYQAEFSRSRSNRVRIRGVEHAKSGSARATPPWDGGRGWRPKNTPLPHTYYHAEYGRSALKGVGINTGKLHKLRSAATCEKFWTL